MVFHSAEQVLAIVGGTIAILIALVGLVAWFVRLRQLAEDNRREIRDALRHDVHDLAEEQGEHGERIARVEEQQRIQDGRLDRLETGARTGNVRFLSGDR